MVRQKSAQALKRSRCDVLRRHHGLLLALNHVSYFTEGKIYIPKRGLNVRLRILMYCFYWLFVFTAWRSDKFREKLMEKDAILVMKAKDRKIARTYIFNAGKVTSTSGEQHEADCKLVWGTAREGGRIMTAVAKGDPKALMRSVIDGKLTLEGDAVAVTWYMASVSMLGKMYSKKKKQNSKKADPESLA